MARRSRSSRSHVIEFAFVLIAIIVVYVWMTNGGPEAFGRWFADYMTRR